MFFFWMKNTKRESTSTFLLFFVSNTHCRGEKQQHFSDAAYIYEIERENVLVAEERLHAPLNHYYM
jgi:hypothetical protein